MYQYINVVYRGENMEKLLEKLKGKGKILNKDDDFYKKEPLGIIFIGNNINNWITKRKNFYGWKIIKVNVHTADIIELKK